MHAIAVLAVQDRRPGIAVGLQARPGRLLELVEDGPDLLVGRAVLRRPRDHERGVLVLEAERVGESGDMVGVPAQHIDARTHQPGGIALADEVVGRGPGGAGAALGAANVHRRPLRGSGQPHAVTARTPRGWRSP